MKIQLLIVFCLFTIFLSAQNPADLDDTFVPVNDKSADDGAAILAIQSDGKILKVGYKDGFANQIIRLNANGTRDETFFTSTNFDNNIYSIAIQSDGKIILGGNFTTFSGITTNRIIRLNADGTRDTSFNVETGFNSTVLSIVVQSNGKIIVGGDFTTFNGTAVNKIIRLNIDGTNDSSFNTGTGFNNSVSSIFIQSDGKIILGGSFTSFNGIVSNRIIQLNTDGTRSVLFNVGETGFNSNVSSIFIQLDGKIIVGGGFSSFNGIRANGIVRLNIDGSKDSSFKTGTGFSSSVSSIAIQTDRKIIVGGSFTSFNGTTVKYIIRLNADGTRDTSFNTGTGFNGSVESIAMQSDGKIIIGGGKEGFSTFNEIVANKIIRLNSDGTRDSSFNTGPWTGFNDFIKSIAIQSDGKIIVGGDFTTFNGVIVNRIIRLNTNGTRDTSFYTGIGFNGSVSSIGIQSDGKIILGGAFTNPNRIVRLNIDGSRDYSFNTGIGFDDYVSSIAVRSDGRIIVGGSFTTFNGQASNRIIGLNTDGMRDASFSLGSGFGDSVYSIAIQSDGKIIVGGSFATFNREVAQGIIRLNTSGARDRSFNPLTRSGTQVYSIAVQSNGGIIIGANFTTFDGIIRLNIDGSRDVLFNTGIVDSTVLSIAIESDGKIIVGGGFTTFNEIAANKIIRLNTDGTSDSLFNSGAGFNSSINKIAIQPDGKIVIGGYFARYMGVLVSTIVRLSGSPVLSMNKFSVNKFSLYPNPAKEFLHLNLEDSITPYYYEIYDLLGKSIKSEAVFENQIDVNNLSNGLYILKVNTSNGILTSKFLKD